MDAPKPKSCPICNGPVEAPPGNTCFPFCSSRCRVIDLGNWVSGVYAIPAVEDDGDEGEPGDGPDGLVH